MKWLVSVDPSNSESVRQYCRWVRQMDIEPVPVWWIHKPPNVAAFDALLLCGGGDVHPSFYNGKPAGPLRQVNVRRDRFELDLILAFFEQCRPVFGICRGIQIVNVALHGGLIQDIPRWLRFRRATFEHHDVRGPSYAEHAIECMQNSEFAQVLSAVKQVNSSHHQAIDPERVGRGLEVVARSPAGIIEAVSGVDLPTPVFAVQWHPERLPIDHPASGTVLRYWHQVAARSRPRHKPLAAPAKSA